MLADDILGLLVCPQSKQPLRYGSKKLLTKLNKRIKSGSLTFLSGATINEPLNDILVRDDGNIAYGVFDEIPNLLADEGIEIQKI
ncbi:MAG: hypothetical protein ACPGQS_03315 [Bradymonadia bacterium]